MRKPRLMNRPYWMYFSVTSMTQPRKENTKNSTISRHSSVQFMHSTSYTSDIASHYRGKPYKLSRNTKKVLHFCEKMI